MIVSRSCLLLIDLQATTVIQYIPLPNQLGTLCQWQAASLPGTSQSIVTTTENYILLL